MASYLLPRLFPVPRMLAMDGGGVEISNHAIKYFAFNVLSKRREVATYGEVPLPQGVIVDGEIRNREALIRALAEVRSRCGFTFAYASLPEQKGYLFDLPAPAQDNAMPLRDAVSLALSEHVPLSPAETSFDCELAGDERDEGGRRIVVTAFPERIAEQYADVFLATGFSPLAFELEPQAAARTVSVRGAEAALVVDCALGQTVFSVVQGGAVRFTTSAPGALVLDETLRALAMRGEHRGDVAWLAAEVVKYKMESGLAAEGPVLEACRAYASALISAAGRVLVYWRSRAAQGETSAAVETVILHGGNASMRGLAEQVGRETGVACRVANLDAALGVSDSIPPIQKNDALRFATAIGLALRAAAYTSL